MKKQISRISLRQTAKVVSLVSFILLEIIAVFLAIFAMIGIEVETPDGSKAAPWGPLFFLIFPIFYALFIYIYTIIVGFFYNTIAKYFGGIEFEVSDKESIKSIENNTPQI